MANLFKVGFAIKLVKPSKRSKERKAVNKNISRRTLAVIILVDNEYKARINIPDDSNTHIVIPLTEKSFELKGKKHVFYKHLDERGKHVCYIRDDYSRMTKGNNNFNLVSIIPDILVCGKIIKVDEKMFFDYEELVAFKSNLPHINPVRIDYDKPLFK